MTFPTQLLSFFNSQQNQINYNLPGTYQFTVPEGVSSLSAVAIGGGGGGSGSDGARVSTGGGGGGGTSWAVFGVQPGDVLTVNVATGGTGGTDGTGGASFNGVNGGMSSINIESRPGILGSLNEPILRAFGGNGGGLGGGTGGTGNNAIPSVYCPIYLQGGGNGGLGGTQASGTGASGGGGAGGYNGNGGNGGSGGTPGTTNPTDAAANSGGGGGGGGSADELGYGGGGVGGFGFVGTGQGAAGINNSRGGDGASYFIDPNEGIVAEPVGQTFSITDTINYPLTLNASTGLYDQPLQPGDFLLLLSASDSTSGITQIPVPTGFTEISRSNDGEYYTNGTLTSNSGILEIVPSNISQTTATRDLNFTTSYRIVPQTGLSGTLTGLTSSSIHTIIVLRGIPTPISLFWSNASGDPGVAGVGDVFATLMPDPPSVTGIPPGSVSIIAGFLANNILNAVGTAGANTTAINEVSGGTPINGQGIGLCASYIQTVGTGTTDPDAFLTGTASHARAYSLQINKSDPTNGNDIIVVGSAVTFTANPAPAGGTLSMSIPTDAISGDLLVLITASDNPATPGAPTLAGVNWLNTFPNGITATPPLYDLGGGNNITGWTNDRRGIGGLGYRISYVVYNGGSRTITNLINGGINNGVITTPATHMVIALRNTAGQISKGVVWDNGATVATASTSYGPPDPPPINVDSNRALVLAIGMVDNIKISNVTTITAPPNYTMLAEPQSYGVQNNGAIIMTANRNNLSVITDDPSAFEGNGGNIWVSQTVIVSGPTTTGTRDAPGFYGGGGASMADDTIGVGMTGSQGSVRIIWGTGRRYPSSNQVNKSLFDSVP